MYADAQPPAEELALTLLLRSSKAEFFERVFAPIIAFELKREMHLLRAQKIGEELELHFNT